MDLRSDLESLRPGWLDHDSHSLGFVIVKLVLSSLLYGCFYGVRTWSNFREPVPFPHIYPSPK